MPRISEGVVEVVKAKSFVDGYGFLQFRHSFQIDLPVACLPGEGQRRFDQLFAETAAPGAGVQVHFYQFTYSGW